MPLNKKKKTNQPTVKHASRLFITVIWLISLPLEERKRL